MEIRFMEHGLDGLAVPLSTDDIAFFHHAIVLQAVQDAVQDGAADAHSTDDTSFSVPTLPALVYICGESGSALDVARSLAQKDLLPAWGSLLTGSQNAGRGQLRRSWLSPRGNIYAALRLPHEGFLKTSAAAPLTGALLASAFRAYGLDVSVKWPNDLVLLYHGAWHKIGGILLEEYGDILLAGVGINVISAPPDHLMRTNHAMSAGFLEEYLQWKPAHILDLWYGLVKETFFCYEQEVNSKKCDWCAFAEQYLLWKGQRVTLLDDDCAHEGRLVGLNPDGGLRLENGTGTQTFYSGSLRMSEDALR